MRLIFVGDLINKGPDSLGVLALARSLGAEMTIGNHELGFLAYLRGKRSGNRDLAAVRRQLGADVKAWADWIETWPLYIEDPDFLVVHAGLAPGRHPSGTSARILTNIRTWDGEGQVLEREGDPPWFELYQEPKLVVYGHWARRGLTVRSNAIGLDTGCVYGKELTGLLLPERRIVQVPARRMYKRPGA